MREVTKYIVKNCYKITIQEFQKLLVGMIITLSPFHAELELDLRQSLLIYNLFKYVYSVPDTFVSTGIKMVNKIVYIPALTET